jgi:DNA-binding CsgD family transcriptional regulator
VARDLLWEGLALAEEWGQYATAAETLHDLVRMGAGESAAKQLEKMGERVDGAFMEARIMFAQATRHGDMDRAATAAKLFGAIGANLFAAESASLEATLADAAGLRRRATDAEGRAARLLEQCEGGRTPGHLPQREVAQLTDREHEVARLAAQGLTSREIAEGLFVSVRTVDNHLQQVYVKLGIKRRSELAGRLSSVQGATRAG